MAIKKHCLVCKRDISGRRWQRTCSAKCRAICKERTVKRGNDRLRRRIARNPEYREHIRQRKQKTNTERYKRKRHEILKRKKNKYREKHGDGWYIWRKLRARQRRRKAIARAKGKHCVVCGANTYNNKRNTCSALCAAERRNALAREQKRAKYWNDPMWRDAKLEIDRCRRCDPKYREQQKAKQIKRNAPIKALQAIGWLNGLNIATVPKPREAKNPARVVISGTCRCFVGGRSARRGKGAGRQSKLPRLQAAKQRIRMRNRTYNNPNTFRRGSVIEVDRGGTARLVRSNVPADKKRESASKAGRKKSALLAALRQIGFLDRNYGVTALKPERMEP